MGDKPGSMRAVIDLRPILQREKISATGSFSLCASLHPFNQQLRPIFFPATPFNRQLKSAIKPKSSAFCIETHLAQQNVAHIENVPCLCCLVKNVAALGLVWLPRESCRQMTLSTCALLPSARMAHQLEGATRE